MRILLTFTLCFVIGLFPLTAGAANIHDVQPGEIWYLDETLENRLVLILGKRDGWVKVQPRGGAVKWVRASDLLTENQSSIDDLEEHIIGWTAIAALLYCGFSDKGCHSQTR